MNCYSCNGGKNHMQGKDLPLPPTTTDGHPTEGSPASIKGGSGSMVTSSQKKLGSSGKSTNPYAGMGGM